VTQFNARCIIWNRACLFGNILNLIGGHEQKFRFAVNEAGDEPRAGDSVNVNVGTGDP
jgi:hypothetical protein